MSFPSKLSSSPSLQRDYAILGNRPAQQARHPPTLRHLTEENLEHATNQRHDEGAGGSGAALDESVTESDSAAMALDQDNMSNLSLPSEDVRVAIPSEREGGQGRDGGGQSSSSKKSSSRRSSLAHTSPYMGPSSYGGDYSRGNRMTNLHQQLSSAPVQMRHAEGTPHGLVNGAQDHSSSLGGFLSSSYVLGGHHVMPPAEADMRSQDELDELSQSAAALRPYEDDVAHRPGAQQAVLYAQESADSVRHRNHVAPRHALATETSPLIGNSTTSAFKGPGNGHSSYTEPLDSRAGATTRRRLSNSFLQSGWDTRQPPPPDQAQIDAMGRESDAHLHRREITILTRFAIPIWLTHLLELSLNVVSVFSLGHIGTNELAAASLSSMTANVTGFSVLAGFISALDSILPSAYTSQPKMVGLYTQRMLVIVTAMLFPIVTCWLNAERILLLLGQDPLVAALAGRYLSILVIGLPGYAGFEVCRRYLQAQNLMHAPTIVLLVASPVNALLTWLFVWGPDSLRYGFIGAPMASVVSMWLMFILGATQCYIAPRVAWDGWTRRAFSGLSPIVRLGAAGMLAMCAEWWSWEIVGLVTSKLGTIALAAQSVLLVCSSISYQLPYAISVAAAVRVGNLLGALQARQANISANMSLFMSLVAGVLNSAIFMLLRNRLGTYFSEDPEVIKLITLVIPVMAAFQVMDGLTGVAGGILRGTGRQGAGAMINLTGYYVIGIPFGLFLTFGPPQMGLSGLWIGLTVSLMYASIFIYLIIKRTNWVAEVRKSLARMALDQSGIKVPVGVDVEGEDLVHAHA